MELLGIKWPISDIQSSVKVGQVCPGETKTTTHILQQSDISRLVYQIPIDPHCVLLTQQIPEVVIRHLSTFVQHFLSRAAFVQQHGDRISSIHSIHLLPYSILPYFNSSLIPSSTHSLISKVQFRKSVTFSGKFFQSSITPRWLMISSPCMQSVPSSYMYNRMILHGYMSHVWIHELTFL